ncbi:S-layer homology domain-containing protein [Candidatus Bipolaricaulota bacterium]
MKRNLGIRLISVFVSVCIVGLLGGAAFGQTGNGHAEPPNTGGLFTDVPRDHWAYEDLEYLAARGIITGLPGGRYEGDTALDRYDAAAMISRAIKYMQNNPESVTLEDLNVLKDLIFQVSDDVTILQSQLGTSQGTDFSSLQNRVSQTELEIAQLNTQIQDISTSSSSTLARRVQANFFISLTALLVGIIGVALATLGL